MPTFSTYSLSNPLTPAQIWAENKEAVQNQVVEYHQVCFPLIREASNLFKMKTEQGSFVTFKMFNEGARHFAHSLRIYPRINGRINVESQFEFTNEVNLAAQTILEEEGKEYFTLAVVDKVAYGLLHDYNPVFHAELLAQLEAQGLASKVAYTHLNHRMMEVFFKGKVEGEEAEYGLVVRNGSTGTISLTYGSYFRIKDEENKIKYVYYFRDAKTVLHLSTVEGWKEGFEAVLEELLAYRVDDILQATTVDQVKSIFVKVVEGIKSEKQQEVAKELIRDLMGKNLTLFEAVEELVSKIQHGTSGTVKKLNDAIMEYATEKVGE